MYFTVIIKVHIFNNGDINTVLTYDQTIQLQLTLPPGLHTAIGQSFPSSLQADRGHGHRLMRDSHGSHRQHTLYLPKGQSSFPYKYNKIIKNLTFLLSLGFIDLSGAHIQKIQLAPPFFTPPSPLTGSGINLSSQFKLPMVTRSVSCMTSAAAPGWRNRTHVPMS